MTRRNELFSLKGVRWESVSTSLSLFVHLQQLLVQGAYTRYLPIPLLAKHGIVQVKRKNKKFHQSTFSTSYSVDHTLLRLYWSLFHMIAPAVKSNGSVQTVFDFSAFVAPPTTPNRRPSKIRWNVVTNQPKSEHSQSTQTQTRKRKRSIQKNAMSQSLATNDFDNNTISTRSFGPITYTTYQSHGEQKICHEEDITPVDVHTLILGTHPGIQSLEKGEYYGHPMK